MARGRQLEQAADRLLAALDDGDDEELAVAVTRLWQARLPQREVRIPAAGCFDPVTPCEGCVKA